MMRNIPIAVPPPSVLCERNTHSQFPVYGPGDHITSSERTILVRCVRGEDHEVPGPYSVFTLLVEALPLFLVSSPSRICWRRLATTAVQPVWWLARTPAPFSPRK